MKNNVKRRFTLPSTKSTNLCWVISDLENGLSTCLMQTFVEWWPINLIQNYRLEFECKFENEFETGFKFELEFESEFEIEYEIEIEFKFEFNLAVKIVLSFLFKTLYI